MSTPRSALMGLRPSARKRLNNRNKEEKSTDDCHHTQALVRIVSVKATLNDPFGRPTLPTIVVSRGPSLNTDASTTSRTPHMHARDGRNDGDRILQGFAEGRAPLGSHAGSRVFVRTASCFRPGLSRRFRAESRPSRTARSLTS